MNRRISLVAMAAVALLGQACLKEPENEADKYAKENEQQIQKFLADSSYNYQKTESGVYVIKTLENAAGEQPQTGSQLYVHYQGRRLTDNFLFDQSSRAGNRPLVFALDAGSVIPGFNDGIATLRAGERAKLLIPSSLGYGYANLPNLNLPPYTTLKFDVEMMAVRTEDQALRVFATDTLKLDPAQLQPITSAPGAYYAKIQEGPGLAIQNGQKVNFKYRGRFIDGRNFAPANSTSSLTLGQGRAIKGVEEAIRGMKQGEKGVVFVPSSQGYGEQGNQGIPGYSPLIFDIEVVSLE